MILNSQESNSIQTSGSLESKKATINGDKIAKLIIGKLARLLS